MKKKIIAPVVITVLVLLYLIIFVVSLLTTTQFHPAMTFFLIPVLAVGLGMIHVLRERIQEIKGGEEEDLSDY